MSAARLVGRLEDLIDRLPKEGLKAAKVVNLVARLADLASRIDEAISRAQCIAEARGSQVKRGNTTLHDPKCAGIFVAVEDGSKRIWKIRNSTFSARITGDTVEIEDEEVGIRITAGEVTVKIIAGDSKKEEPTELSDLDSIYSGYHSVSYVLKRVEAHVRVLESDLAKCARESGTQC